MSSQSATAAGRILIVDDEPDILESLEEVLEAYSVSKASSYETACERLEKEHFDTAILDIMGVRGYDLLKLAVEKEIPAIMLTAHALTAEDLIASLRNGAYAYVPKDKLSDIAFFVDDALKARQQGAEQAGKWFEKLKPFFLKKFGPDALTRIKGFHI
jgi:DNA-binding NtrC family response regulator